MLILIDGLIGVIVVSGIRLFRNRSSQPRFECWKIAFARNNSMTLDDPFHEKILVSRDTRVTRCWILARARNFIRIDIETLAKFEEINSPSSRVWSNKSQLVICRSMYQVILFQLRLNFTRVSIVLSNLFSTKRIKSNLVGDSCYKEIIQLRCVTLRFLSTLKFTSSFSYSFVRNISPLTLLQNRRRHWIG